MITLDRNLLNAVKRDLNKQAFVPMPGGQAEPVAGAGPMTAGMVAPMGDPGMGGDPGMDGMPMDPGMMPHPGLDPAMAGMMGGMPPPPPPGGEAGPEGAPNGTITLTINDLIKLFKVFSTSAQPQQAAPQQQQTTSDPKLDEIIALLKGSLG